MAKRMTKSAKSTIQSIIKVFEDRENWDKQDLVNTIFEEIDGCSNLTIDEVALVKGGAKLMDLSTFTDAFFNIIFDAVVGVLKEV